MRPTEPLTPDHAAFTDQREAAARDGQELLLDSDPGHRELEAMSYLMEPLVASLDAHGLSLRMMPASYAPSPQDRSRTSAWMDESEPNVVCVGVSRNTRPAQAVRAGARVLALAEGFPGFDGEEGQARCVADAVVESFALSFLAEHGFDAELTRVRRVLGRRLSDRRLQGVSDDDAKSAAIHAWACLCATAPDAQAPLIGHLSHISPRVGELLNAAEATVGFNSPQTGEQARGCCERLLTALRA